MLDVCLFDLLGVLVILIKHLPLVEGQNVVLQLELAFVLFDLRVLKNMKLFTEVEMLLLLEDLLDFALHLPQLYLLPLHLSLLHLYLLVL